MCTSGRKEWRELPEREERNLPRVTVIGGRDDIKTGDSI